MILLRVLTKWLRFYLAKLCVRACMWVSGCVRWQRVYWCLVIVDNGCGWPCFLWHQGYDKEAGIIMMEIRCVHHLVAPVFIQVMTADLWPPGRAQQDNRCRGNEIRWRRGPCCSVWLQEEQENRNIASDHRQKDCGAIVLCGVQN